MTRRYIAVKMHFVLVAGQKHTANGTAAAAHNSATSGRRQHLSLGEKWGDRRATTLDCPSI